MLTDEEIRAFQRNLLCWYGAQRRDLPWRRTRDPYAIWVSEIMLQQTRVSAAIPYYGRFLKRFPNLKTLAEATEAELLASWGGLGYYYRARHLQKAAQLMRETGGFPSTYEEIRRLPGIGDYTAAAVASIGFGLPHAVLDGNVFRVLSRVFDDQTNIASAGGRRHFAGLAEKLLDRNQPGAFNQGVMELGATICLPVNPQCLLCPVSTLCEARQNGTQSERPVKIAARKSVEEKRVVFWVEREGKLLVWQRPPDSRLMPGFWELPERMHLPDVDEGRLIGWFRHWITFHKFVFEVHEADAPLEIGACQWLSMEDAATVPVSTIVRKASRLKKARLKD